MEESSLNDILELFRSGCSVRDVSRRTGYSRPTISTAVRKAGLKPTQRKYGVNASFFESIDTAEKAYWLGFLLADGHISERIIEFDGGFKRIAKGMTVNLQRGDEGHLEAFKNSLNYGGPVLRKNPIDKRTGKVCEQSILSISSARLVKPLVERSWHEFKRNGDTSILESVQPNLVVDLMSGMFDGDGGFVICRSGQALMYFVDMHLSVVTWFQDRLIEVFGFNRTKVFANKKKRVFRVQYRGNVQVMRFLQSAYSRQPSLNRKMLKFESFALARSSKAASDILWRPRVEPAPDQESSRSAKG